jgi:hypothetical protein
LKFCRAGAGKTCAPAFQTLISIRLRLWLSWMERLPSKSKTVFSGIITPSSTVDFIGIFHHASSGKIRLARIQRLEQESVAFCGSSNKELFRQSQ